MRFGLPHGLPIVKVEYSIIASAITAPAVAPAIPPAHHSRLVGRSAWTDGASVPR